MPKNLKFISVDGETIQEGLIINKWLDHRFNANKNALIAVVGGTGSGKTYASLSQCEKWYKYKFDAAFPVENICFSIEEAAKRIQIGKLRRGELLLMEEAGVLMNSLDFQSKIAKFFGSVLQSFRSKNIGIIFTLPNISMLNKTARSLLHLVLQTTSINQITNQVVLKPFYTQTNALTGKDYHKYLRQKVGPRFVKIERINIGLPSADLITVYEEKKEKFVDKVVNDLVTITDNDKKEKVDNRKTSLEKVPPLWEAVKLFYERGITNQTEIAKQLDISQQTVSSALKGMIQKGYFRPKYLEKAQNYVQNPDLMQTSI